ncbi:nuclear pore complex protein Nup93-like [Lineus longissimus]|uniref:nuclear pore complex protein Nup93-like n=1 Tax=Lineus longissimus TaxID=88925 RepID=UPI002B4E77C3
MEVDAEGFSDLLQQAEQLTAEMDTGTDLPRVERNLQQVLEAGQRLWSRTHAIQDSTDVKASVLLGSKGFDVPRISQKLETLGAVKTFEPLEPVRDTDIQGFLRNERENALLAVIEQTRKNTFEQTSCHHWARQEDEWEREKQRILNALVGTGQETMDFPQETEGLLNDSVSMNGRSTLDSTEMAYAKQVYIYNDQVIQKGLRRELSEMCAQVGEKVDDKNMVEIWSMVHHMTQVPMAAGNIVTARNSKKMQMAFVTQARKYLEHLYKKYIQSCIYGNRQQAKLGGIPGTYPLVRSFLNVKVPAGTQGLEDGTIDGHPVWALVYYCVRCGDLQAALNIVKTSAKQLGEFEGYLQEYAHGEDRRLSPENETKIKLQYRRSVRNSTDPYKRALYCLIGCCDPQDNHSEVADKTDDYLWIKLCQIGFTESDTSQDQLTLSQLQTTLLEEYGESHFNAYQVPVNYFTVLFLTAQFEAAIGFLAHIDKLRCHAVHIAMVLYELNLLARPHTTQAQLLTQDVSDPKPMRRLNFARLIMMYTRKFEATDPREALQYFFFLRDLRTSQGDNLFMTCVSELVLETREFEMLLGKLVKDGTRRPGAIDKFNADTQKIIELVAKDTENKGHFEDAVKLYDLARNHEKVLELLNKLLTQVLSQAPTPQSARDRLKALAVAIAERYRSLGQEGTRSTTCTFYLLLDLMTFFDEYHAQHLDQAMDTIVQLKLLPTTTETVERLVNNFKHYTDEIRRSLPDVLLATMNILYLQSKKVRSSGFQSPLLSKSTFGRDDGGQDSYLNQLRRQARALITFAGMIPYRMPGDTNSRLVQLEVLMN